MPGDCAAAGSGRVSCVTPLTSALLGAAVSAAVDVGCWRDAGLLPFADGLAVQVLVPPDGPPDPLLGFDVGPLGLQLLDELRHVRLVVGTPENAEQLGH